MGIRSLEFATSSTMGRCTEEGEGEEGGTDATLFSRAVEARREGDRVNEDSDFFLLEWRDRNEYRLQLRFSSSTSLSNGEASPEKTPSSSYDVNGEELD